MSVVTVIKYDVVEIVLSKWLLKEFKGKASYEVRDPLFEKFRTTVTESSYNRRIQRVALGIGRLMRLGLLLWLVFSPHYIPGAG
jgi:hypothetical protein